MAAIETKGYPLDFLLKKQRLKSPEKATPRFFPIVRKADKEPILGCCLCQDEFFRRVIILSDKPYFVWHTKDYFYIPGDSMITLKNHRDGYLNLTLGEFTELMYFVDGIMGTYQKIPEVKRITFLQAVGGKVAGQGVENHFHAHLFPSYRPEIEYNICQISKDNNFIIQDSSSYFLTLIMRHYAKRGLALEPSLVFPGGLKFSSHEDPAFVLALLQTLEKGFYESMTKVSSLIKNEPDIEGKIMILQEVTQAPFNPRSQAIFRWMLKPFSQNDLHLFGYNLFLDQGEFTFLPRSGMVGGKRIGAVSIFGNLHWVTKSLGDERNPVVYSAPLSEYPQNYLDFDRHVISSLKSMSSAPAYY